MPTFAPAALALDLVVAGPERLIFDQRTQACDASDLPDAPARAFRDAQGQMVLFAPNFRNRAFVGPDIDHLARDCAVRFAAKGKANPQLLDDRTWLHAFHTRDGVNVFALASASFIPYRHGTVCAAGPARTDCWRNGLVALVSHDGGRSFTNSAPPPKHALMPPPEAYSAQVKNPAGFISATNIVPFKGDLYSIVWRRDANARQSRNCLVRARGGNTDHWEVLTNGGFAALADRMADGWHVRTTDCDRIGPRGLPAIRGLVLHPATGTFVAVFQHRRRGPDGTAEAGFFTVQSQDLISWSQPRLLLPVALRGDREAEGARAGYPSLIDDTSADRDFGTVGETADLLFVRFLTQTNGGRVRTLRALVAVPLKLVP
ncbi:MAG: hypothetical protein B7Y12_16085 [Rhizobiales bacterium 24-66-13]|jgi:hypothetical protein|nr:MAG: hypothetical protein B7Z45_02405 [Azorhizobium sp. 12-66-6]OYZ71975.1 MAG: hypothetical protein B7Y12_16085 [Rhizobiales bacterium 24-66-13]HQS08103.1 hypothetical protein [Xanthobacteraceae bacterium]HQS49012.1 hypothetical protein [Xanthobacteraceae bacterium]